MKKCIALTLFAVVCFAAGRLSSSLPVIAEGGGVGDVAPPTCQDVNGDGAANITDAVYLLNWLFLGGPEPECAIGDGPAGLPDTGQTTCYDEVGNVVDCTSDNTCAGQDGLYATGCPMEDRFVDNEDGTVTDTCTGLMWQRDTGNDGNPLPWCDALAYCESLDLAGRDDWRLPNVRELQEHRRLRAARSGDRSGVRHEVGVVLVVYAGRSFPGLAWYVRFGYGGVRYGDKDFGVRVRAVRSGP